MTRLREHYKEVVRDALQKEFSYEKQCMQEPIHPLHNLGGSMLLPDKLCQRSLRHQQIGRASCRERC